MNCVVEAFSVAVAADVTMILKSWVSDDKDRMVKSLSLLLILLMMLLSNLMICQLSTEMATMTMSVATPPTMTALATRIINGDVMIVRVCDERNGGILVFGGVLVHAKRRKMHCRVAHQRRSAEE